MIRTARELGAFLDAEVEGDPSAPISGIASPEAAAPEDLIYVESPRHVGRAAASAARCAIVARDAALPGKTLLRVAHPKLAFARAAAWLVPPPRLAEGIHPTALLAPSARLGAGVTVGPYAVVEADAEIGAGTEVGAYCFVGARVRVGEGCRLYPRVTLYPDVQLGRRVVVHAGAVIGSDGFGYVFGEGRHWKFPQVGRVEVGDDVEIGSNTTIDRGALDATRIGAGTKVDNLVQVAHNVSIGEHTVIAAQTGISGSSSLGSQVVVGGQVGIADHCRIEDAAVLGAQAGIPSGKAIHRGQTVWGTPARPLERFKEQWGWFARLPALAERVRQLEEREKKR